MRRPTVVVAGDDRAARDLAADLRAWLHAAAGALLPEPRRRLRVAPRAAAAPRRPARRGARRAARAPRRARRRRSSSCPPSRCPRRSPTPSCARTASRSRSASCSTSTRPSLKLVAAGYERVDQVEDRGQFAVRGGLLDIYPATEERAVRVELFDIEIESLRWFSTFTQRSLGEGQRVEIAPAAELAAEHRELAEIAALEDDESRPDVAELLPGRPLPRAARPAPRAHRRRDRRRRGRRARAARPLGRRLRRLPRHRRAPPLRRAATRSRRRSTRAQPLRLSSSISGSQPIEFRAQAAEFAARSLREAEPELEKLTRSGYTTLVTWPQRGQGERAAYNLAAPAGDAGSRQDGGLVFAEANLRDGFVAPAAEARRDPRAPADPPPRPRSSGRRAAGRGLLRSFADLRTGDIVVHEDHGLARFAGFDTKTVAGVTRDYLEPRVPGHRQGLHAGRPAREDLALRRRRRRRTRRSPSSAARAGRR